MSEGRANRISIGTTSRGIGPCYEDKTGRRGIRIADLFDPESFRELYDTLAEESRPSPPRFNIHDDHRLRENPPPVRGIRGAPPPAWSAIPPNIWPTAIAAGKSVLFEGAQGTMLDVDHGTYPFVTSSSATAGGACTGTGVGPTRIQGVIGVSKAYITRVGAGPFPNRSSRRSRRDPAPRGNEFGAVTGRPRRCGWFDVPLLATPAMVNGFDSCSSPNSTCWMISTEIPVCTGYKLNGQQDHRNARHLPADRSDRAHLREASRLENADARHHPFRRPSRART